MSGRDPYEELLDELVAAIELRECGDPDGRDWSLDARIRRLEHRLMEQHRWRSNARPTGPRTTEEVRPLAASHP